MKLRNKETGEIGELHFESDKEYHFTVVTEDPADIRIYKELSLLSEEWKDYEEPKEVWFISNNGQIHAEDGHDRYREERQSIGNYFETKEEAEKAVEKLKAWKRLKGGGFEFMSCSYGHDKTTDDSGGWIRFRVNHLYDDRYSCEVEKDLDLLFGGEE